MGIRCDMFVRVLAQGLEYGKYLVSAGYYHLESHFSTRDKYILIVNSLKHKT